MKAKEMFEELGYEQDIPDDYDDITYSKPILDKNTFGYIDSEMINFYENRVWFTNKSDLSPEEVEAIYEMIKELGWLGSDKE